MYVEHLQLHDFRSYPSAEVALGPGVSVFVGANGQGKTNLVEAVEYLSTLSSHRVSQDAPLVRAGTGQAVVRARVRAGREDDRTLLLECEINPGRANRARINRTPQPRTRDLLGVLRTVVFSPEDLAIVKGDPSDRRAFLDQVVVTRWPRMAGVKQDHERVLRHRNALLKTLSGRYRPPRSGSSSQGGSSDPDAEHTLEVWDDQLAELGAELLLARLDTLAELVPLAAEAYAAIAPLNNTVDAQYRSALDLSGELSRGELAQRLREAMRERRADEVARGMSLVGPQRDEVVLSIGDLPAKGYASHGESWSLALSLKLAAFGLVRRDGTEPVLVLDDVFAELDQTRRERLAAAVKDAEQVLVTAAVGADVPDLLAGQRFRVVKGAVSPEEVDDDAAS